MSAFGRQPFESPHAGFAFQIDPTDFLLRFDHVTASHRQGGNPGPCACIVTALDGSISARSAPNRQGCAANGSTNLTEFETRIPSTWFLRAVSSPHGTLPGREAMTDLPKRIEIHEKCPREASDRSGSNPRDNPFCEALRKPPA